MSSLEPTLAWETKLCGPLLTRRGGVRRRPEHNSCIKRGRHVGHSPHRNSSDQSPYQHMNTTARVSMIQVPAPSSATISQPRESRPAIARPLRNYDAVEIRDTGNRCGRGVFALKDFEKGHKIITERPIVSCIHWMQPNGRRTIADEWAKLPTCRQENLKNLFSRRLKDIPVGSTFPSQHKKQLQRFIDEYGFWDPQRARAHIYILGSHINHACISCANAEQWTDSEYPHRIHVRLVKPLKEGDELLINYNRQNLSFGCAVCGPPSFTDRFKSLGNSIFR